MPKVLHIITGLEIGGAELMLHRFITSACGGGFEHVVASLDPVGDMKKRLEAENVELYAFDFKRSPLMQFFRLISLIRRLKPDVVQTWLYHSDFLGGLAAKLATNCPVVWNIRSTAIPQGFLSLTFWLVRLCAICSYFIPSRIICCAIAAKAAHLKLGYCARKMVMIPNGYDFSIYESLPARSLKIRHRLGIEDWATVVGVVGRFDPLKDFYNFVVAASHLIENHKSAKFLMVGRGNEWSNNELRSWIEKLGLADNFYLVGEQAKMADYFSAMDVFCLPSAQEGFPNVVVEAMAMGLPCVVTRAGDAPLIVGEHGLVVPTRDSASLAKALLHMCELSDEGRKILGIRGKNAVKKLYGIQDIRLKYENLYGEVLENEKNSH